MQETTEAISRLKMMAKP